MEALRFTLDRLDFEAGQHPFLRAAMARDAGFLEEVRREMGYFALALSHALDVLERGGLEPPLQRLALQVRSAVEAFLPEDRAGAMVLAFRHDSADLRQAAVMVIQQVASVKDSLEAWAVLTALDAIMGRMAEAFRLDPAAAALPDEGGLRALQAGGISPETRERLEDGLSYLFEAGLRLQDHLLLTLQGRDPVARGV